MKYFLASFLVVLIAGCNQKEKSKSAQKEEPMCGGNLSLTCLLQADWEIKKDITALPKNIQMTIQGFVVLDECKPQISFSKVERKIDHMLVSIPSFFVPKEKTVPVSIVNKGIDCKLNSFFYNNEKVEFERTQVANRIKILVNL